MESYDPGRLQPFSLKQLQQWKGVDVLPMNNVARREFPRNQIDIRQLEPHMPGEEGTPGDPQDPQSLGLAQYLCGGLGWPTRNYHNLYAFRRKGRR